MRERTSQRSSTRRWLIIAFAAAILLLPSCTRGDQTDDTGRPPDIVTRYLSLVMVGRPQEAGRDSIGAYWLFVVDEVDWQRLDDLVTVEGDRLVYSTIAPGETVRMYLAEVEPVVGRPYLVLADGFSDRTVGWLLDPDTLTEVPGTLPLMPGIETFTSAEERKDPVRLRVALAELIDDATKMKDARRLGTDFDPSQRLAAAMGAVGLEDDSADVSDSEWLWSIGMTSDEYVELPPDGRQLLPIGELPSSAVADLELVDLDVLVLVPEGFAAVHRHIGLRTIAGVIGPYGLSEKTRNTDLPGSWPGTGGLELVYWEDDDLNLPDTLSRAQPVSLYPSVNTQLAAIDRIDFGQVLLIDLVDQAVRLVDRIQAIEIERDNPNPSAVGR